MALLDDPGGAFLEAADEMAQSREILGVHYPSDAEAGRLFARQMVTELFKSSAFLQDFERAKQEIRRVKQRNAK